MAAAVQLSEVCGEGAPVSRERLGAPRPCTNRTAECGVLPLRGDRAGGRTEPASAADERDERDERGLAARARASAKDSRGERVMQRAEGRASRRRAPQTCECARCGCARAAAAEGARCG